MSVEEDGWSTHSQNTS